MKKILSLCQNRGFIFQGSEIYGGLANTWDYGPLGVELKNNVKRQWWHNFVQKRSNIVGLDSSILLHPRVWEASGHTKSFSDPLVDCKNCKERFRADHLYQSNLDKKKLDKSKSDKKDQREKREERKEIEQKENLSELSHEMIEEKIREKKLLCPNCGSREFTTLRSFNLMFHTFQGVIEDQATRIYLRPETAQGIFINFKNVQRSSRKKLPFGIAQIGKSFRNEITPGNFIFRTREFEQMEIEYFVPPEQQENCFNEWLSESKNWFLDLGLNPKKLRVREHGETELSHYSNRTVDIEYEFPFGWGELEGIASRGNFDLSQHSQYSGEELSYFDPERNESYIPWVIEPSFGVDRTVLTFLLDAFQEQELTKGRRNVLALDHRLVPVQIAVFPLKRNETQLVKKAQEIFSRLNSSFRVEYDDTGSIGKLYRRQDEIGTPFCITVDYESLEKSSTFTIRERDSMQQTRVSSDQMNQYFQERGLIPIS